MTQETLHISQSKKMEVAVMKIDLKKAYDRVDWVFMHLVMYKIGLVREEVAWIMGCIYNTSMVVIINDSDSKFFHPSRGLRQGCVLSPLLFILVMDSLSIKINRVAENGWFRGIDISPQMRVRTFSL